MTRARAKKNPDPPVIRLRRQCSPLTIPTDLERQRFQASARFIDHAKQRDRVIRMLEADYPLTREDKAALAAGIRRLAQDKTDLLRKPTKQDRGRKPADVGPWSYHQAMLDVREFAAAAGKTQRDILDTVSAFWSAHGKDFEQHRARVIKELHIVELVDPTTRRK
jgi:hypothetical protein